jgi:hypothetical protein
MVDMVRSAACSDHGNLQSSIVQSAHQTKGKSGLELRVDGSRGTSWGKIHLVMDKSGSPSSLDRHSVDHKGVSLATQFMGWHRQACKFKLR